MLYAIIDIGSNTIRMAIYNIERGRIEMLFKKKHTVGLAGYVKDGIMQQKGIAKTVEILCEYKEFLAGFRIENVTAFTTAALRGAKNGQAAVSEIAARTGIPIRIITGDEEAVYDFIGATRGLGLESGMIVDIGGASTEIVVFKEQKILGKASLAIGSLALYEKYAEDFLPSKAEADDMRRDVQSALAAQTSFDGVAEDVVCGIGGTFKGAIALYNAMFDEAADNVRMETRNFPAMTAKFLRDGIITQDDTVTLIKTVPDRLKTIIPGLIAAEEITRRFHATAVVYSDSGVREGYIYDRIIKNDAV